MDRVYSLSDPLVPHPLQSLAQSPRSPFAPAHHSRGVSSLTEVSQLDLTPRHKRSPDVARRVDFGPAVDDGEVRKNMDKGKVAAELLSLDDSLNLRSYLCISSPTT